MPGFHQNACLRNFMSCFHGCQERVLFGAKIMCTIGLAREKKNPKESKHIYPLPWPARPSTKLAPTASSSDWMQPVAACLRLLVEELRTVLGTPLGCMTMIYLMLIYLSHL